MKIKNRYLYIILSLFIIVMNLGYGKASEATLCIYFPFIYFSMYIYSIPIHRSFERNYKSTKYTKG